MHPMKELATALAVPPSQTPASPPQPPRSVRSLASRRPLRSVLATAAIGATGAIGAIATIGLLAVAALPALGADSLRGGLGRETAASTSLPAAAAKPVRPTKDALSLIELVRARWMGVDRVGNLWAWDPVEATVRFFSPTAERVATISMPQGTSAVEGDTQWGVVALRDEGSQIVWVRPGQDLDVVRREPAPAAPDAGGAPGTTAAPAAGATEAAPAAGAAPVAAAAAAPAPRQVIDLPDPAAWVCWIDADTVAVSPRWTAHRIEIWSLRDSKLVRSIGNEKPIPRPPGTTRVRDVQLRYDTQRRLLFSLESFTGDLRVFTLDGALVWSASVDNPWQKTEGNRLADLDAKAKAHDTSFPIWFSDLWLEEGPDGSAWVRQQVDVLKQSVTFTKVSAKGKVAEQVGKLRCPGRTFTIWGDNLIFYRDIALPREVCNSIAPLP
jgi:hypothetical protein